MTAEDVLEMWDDSEGDIGELSSDEISDEEFELDDPNEPIMEGSDDEFSDLWVVEESEEEDEDYHSTRPSRNTPGETAVSPPPVLTAVTLSNITQPDPSGFTPQPNPRGPTSQPDPRGPASQPDPRGPTPQPDRRGPTPQPDPRGPTPQPDPRGPTPQPDPRGPTPQPDPRGPTPQPGPRGPTSQPDPRGPTSQPDPRGPTSQPDPRGPTSQPDPRGPTPQPDPRGPTPQPDPRGPTPQPDPRGPTPQPDPRGLTPQPDPRGPTPQPGPRGPTPQPGPRGPTSQPDPRGPTSQPMEWSSTLHPITIDPFTSPVGPTVPISASPLEVLELFFSSDLLEEIVDQSNIYAKQVMGDEDFKKWRRITVQELKAFLGFHILMAINHLPSLDDYWRRDPLLHYAPIADRITRDRFRELSRYLHFADNDSLLPRDAPGYDRLGKVRPVIEHLSTKFAALYEPHREVAIDEAMIKFQGRSSLKQYNPMKPIKRGIKVWVLADSHNGYFMRFQVYTGKDGNRVEHGLGERVVKTLTSELKGKHHHTFFDNFFTSEKLVQDLLADDIYACGTARKDRKGFPPTLKQAKLSTR